MKKIYLFLIIGIALTSLVIAGGILTDTINISLSKTDKAKLGMDKINASELSCYDKYCQITINGIPYPITLIKPYSQMTQKELEDARIEAINLYINMTISSKDKIITTPSKVLNPSEVIINEK